METARAGAYRHILYMAMVDIRNSSDHRAPARSNPLHWRRGYKQMRKSSAIADWLHNMASASAENFSSFDEKAFWSYHKNLCSEYPELGFDRYLDAFETALGSEAAGGTSYWPPTKKANKSEEPTPSPPSD